MKKIPINIAICEGCYTLTIEVGCQQTLLNVMLDTGSSTLAINLNKYNPIKDTHLQTTQYAQCVTYGKGGWAGPVVKTSIKYDESHQLLSSPLAIIKDTVAHNFLSADGILGLAYHHLNKAYYLEKNTMPWEYSTKVKKIGMRKFKHYLWEYPEHDITPEFTQLTNNKVTQNIFSLLTLRSIVYVPNKNMTQQQKMDEPLNQGQFIFGFPHAHQSINTDKQKTLKVFHDAYYNTHLVSIRVEGFDEFNAPKLDKKHQHSFFTNSIIDSGSSYLMLQKDIYDYILESLTQLNSGFVTHIIAFEHAQKSHSTYKPKDLDLSKWPNMYFTFASTNDKQTTLCCKPEQYWQLNAIEPQAAFFTLMKQLPNWPDQSIMGLPLMNNNICVFDRSDQEFGTIKFYSLFDPHL